MLGLINRSPRAGQVLLPKMRGLTIPPPSAARPYSAPQARSHDSPAFGGIHHHSSEILHQPAQGWTGAPTKDARSHDSPAFGGIHHHSSEILHQPAQGWTGAPTKDARSHDSPGRGVCPYTPVNAEDMARLRVTLVASSLFVFLRVPSRFKHHLICSPCRARVGRKSPAQNQAANAPWQ